MLDLVRGYFTTSMALYPDEKRTWQELHHTLLLQQMLEHFLKGWPVPVSYTHLTLPTNSLV